MYRIRDLKNDKYCDETYIVNHKGEVCSAIAIEKNYKDGNKTFEVRNDKLINQENYIVELATNKSDIGDYKGNPFYENDVVKVYKYQYPNDHNTNYKIGRVFIEEGNFNILFEGDKEYQILSKVYSDNHKMEIIGTIHDEEFAHLK